MKETEYKRIRGRGLFMKKYIITTLVLMSSFTLISCGHKHTFTEATCTTPMTCTECGLTEGNPVEHQWAEATCTTPKTCSVCSTTEGSSAEHQWVEATCTTPKTCSVCNATEGKRVEHDWQEATTEVPKTCSLCGLTAGKPLIDAESTLAAHNIDVSQYTGKTKTAIDNANDLYEAGLFTEEEYLDLVNGLISVSDIDNQPAHIPAPDHVKAESTSNLPPNDTRTNIDYSGPASADLSKYSIN